MSGTTPVNTYVYTLGADYKYSTHLSFQAGYNLTDSSSSSSASTFTSNTFTLSAAFRY
jgi:long-subunit fatty acid transport protein